MFGTLIKFFKFCDEENRKKFTGSIIVGIFNSLFMALRIGAVAVMLRGVIGTAIEGHFDGLNDRFYSSLDSI